VGMYAGGIYNLDIAGVHEEKICVGLESIVDGVACERWMTLIPGRSKKQRGLYTAII